METGLVLVRFSIRWVMRSTSSGAAGYSLPGRTMFIPCNKSELEKYGIKDDEAKSDKEPEFVEEGRTEETWV